MATGDLGYWYSIDTVDETGRSMTAGRRWPPVVNPTVPEMIDQLLSGAFAGRGGNRALCRALGVTKLTLHHWRKGKHEPTYDNRQALIALWREQEGD